MSWSNCAFDTEIKCGFFKETKVLGSGQFGIVLLGYILRKDEEKEEESQELVAVKTVKPTVDTLNFLALLSEMKVMAYLGKHPNIACLIATCTSEMKQRTQFYYTLINLNYLIT